MEIIQYSRNHLRYFSDICQAGTVEKNFIKKIIFNLIICEGMGIDFDIFQEKNNTRMNFSQIKYIFELFVKFGT